MNALCKGEFTRYRRTSTHKLSLHIAFVKTTPSSYRLLLFHGTKFGRIIIVGWTIVHGDPNQMQRICKIWSVILHKKKIPWYGFDLKFNNNTLVALFTPPGLRLPPNSNTEHRLLSRPHSGWMQSLFAMLFHWFTYDLCSACTWSVLDHSGDRAWISTQALCYCPPQNEKQAAFLYQIFQCTQTAGVSAPVIHHACSRIISRSRVTKNPRVWRPFDVNYTGRQCELRLQDVRSKNRPLLLF